MSATDVRPLVHPAYDGRDLVLPDDPSAVLRLSEQPDLPSQFGNDIVTASGLTLLGADDKAGVAEIVTAADYLMRHPEIAHGPIRIAFTPDEEIGRGADRFDVQRFGAVCAYTLDGGSRGELEYESFSADAMTLTFNGFNTHPGYAKGRMVNAIRLAARFIDRLPAQTMSPETTGGLRGLRPSVSAGGVGRSHAGEGADPRLRDRGARREGSAGRAARARGGRVSAGRVAGDQDRRVLPQHARGPRSTSGRRRSRARSDPPRRARADRAADPRRHRRLTAVVHGPADAEPLRRRAQLPLPAGVGVGAGHGEGGGGDRRAGARVGERARGAE